MTRYLLDTNVLLRVADLSSSQHEMAKNAIAEILGRGDDCVVTAQVLVEFWVVVSRPVDVNGLGWDTEAVKNYIDNILDHFELLAESQNIFPIWLELVEAYQIKGKRTHDIRILAAMLSHQINHLLTFNPKDFIELPNLVIVHPKEFLNY